jgi:tyrosyl-tRNA synthetase
MIMAQQVTDILTGRIALSDKLNPELLSALKNEIPAITINAHQELAEVLKDCGLASSKTEARKLITANAISINGQKFQDNYLDETVFTSRMILIRRGKAFKDSALVILS